MRKRVRKLGVCLSLLALMMLLLADVRAEDKKEQTTDKKEAAAKLKVKAQSAVDRLKSAAYC